MITAKLSTQIEVADELKVFIDGFLTLVREIGDEITREITSDFLDELQATPPKVKYPIQWTSEKQKRAFFATKGFGRGIPTQRTGKLQSSWRIIGKMVNGKYVLAVTNPESYLPFVVGGINFKSPKQAIQPMQQFHRNTGWQPVQDTVVFWYDAFQELFDKRYDKILREFTQRKTVTRTSRRT